MAAILKAAEESPDNPWRGFKPGPWQKRINVRDFIQRNYTPYEGDASFLAGATERTRKVWEKLCRCLPKKRTKGVLDVSQEPSSILAHAPGYIDKNLELIVGLQTDAPLKRAIMPKGGWRVVEASLKAYGYEPDPDDRRRSSPSTRKTHNDGVFDAYTPEIREGRAPASSPVCPTPTAVAASSATTAGVALYGLDFLIEDKRAERAELDDRIPPKTSSGCARKSPSRCGRCKQIARWRTATATTFRSRPTTRGKRCSGHTSPISPRSRSRTARRCRSGASRRSSTSTSSATCARARSPSPAPRRLIDDLVIKFRIVRFLRTPEYNELFSGDPTWVTEFIGGMGEDGRTW